MHQKWRETIAQKEGVAFCNLVAATRHGPDHPHEKEGAGKDASFPAPSACSISPHVGLGQVNRIGWVSQRPNCGQGDGCNAATDGHRALEGPALPERCRTHGDGMAKAPPGEQMHRTGGKAFAYHVRPDTVTTNPMGPEHPDIVDRWDLRAGRMGGGNTGGRQQSEHESEARENGHQPYF